MKLKSDDTKDITAAANGVITEATWAATEDIVWEVTWNVAGAGVWTITEDAAMIAPSEVWLHEI